MHPLLLALLFSTAVLHPLWERSTAGNEGGGLSEGEIAALIVGIIDIPTHRFDRVQRMGMLEVEKSQ